MRNFIKWLNKPSVLITLVAAGFVTDSVLLGQAYDLSKSDWAAWIGAVGTVGALIGTIWIATSERRARARAERDLAIVTLAALTVRIGSVASALHLVAQWMQHDTQRGIVTDYSRIAEVVKSANPWSPTELAALVCLERHIAARLALTSGAVDTFLSALGEAAKTKAYSSIEGSAKMNHTALPLLEKNARDLRQIYADCMSLMHQSQLGGHLESLDQETQA